MEPQCPSFDRISTLPSHIIETILCLIPIQEAARTSVLSKKWRYKWTKIPELVFSGTYEDATDDQVPVSEETVAFQREKMGKRCKVFYAIYQVLLMRQGPIREFTLFMNLDKTCIEVDHIISYLLRDNTLEKLVLHLFDYGDAFYCLPSSIFSFHHLTHLHLNGCDLERKPTFGGFSRLTTLYLEYVHISTKSLCPLLKHFTLITGKKHLVNDDNTTVIELFKCLPVIEHLSINSDIAECFVVESVSQDLPASLIRLKYIDMEFMSFDFPDELRFLALLISSSPNLEKIKLKVFDWSLDSGIVSAIRNVYLEHLNELNLDGFSNLNPELGFENFLFFALILMKANSRSEDADAIDEKKEVDVIKKLFRRRRTSLLVNFRLLPN